MADFVRRSDGLLVPARLASHRPATVYCDESGNTGPNYLDPEQPFYVLGGWLVPDEQVEAVAVAVEQFRRNRFPKAKELKKRLVLRNDRTKEYAAELIETLGRLHCLPLLLAAEKRFCIAGKVVETFMDPLFNDVLNDGFTGDTTTKIEIANLLYREMSDTPLRDFANAYRAPSPEGLKASLEAIAAAVEVEVSGALATALLAATPHIDEITEAESGIWLPNNVDATLNLPCLVSFLMLVEHLARLGPWRPLNVVHDEHHNYEAGYKKIFEMHKGVPRLFAKLPHTDVTYRGLEHVATFETRASHESPIVQAADVLAGIVAHVIGIAMSDEAPAGADERLVDLLAPLFLSTDPLLSWLVCSEQCLHRFGDRILQPAISRAIPDFIPEATPPQVSAPATPMFPLLGATDRPGPRLSLPLPLFAIVGTESGGLFLLCDAELAPEITDVFGVLFTRRELADKFLSFWDEDALTEPQEIAEYGPREISDLVDALDAANQETNVLIVDPGLEGPLQLTPLDEFTEGMRRAVSRALRLHQTGLARVLSETREVDGVQVLVMQASSGQYGAMVPPDGELFFGDTADLAVARLRESMAGDMGE